MQKNNDVCGPSDTWQRQPAPRLEQGGECRGQAGDEALEVELRVDAAAGLGVGHQLDVPAVPARARPGGRLRNRFPRGAPMQRLAPRRNPEG